MSDKFVPEPNLEKYDASKIDKTASQTIKIADELIRRPPNIKIIHL